jgi:predicted nucleic acid binding AN1-type Zn finger protein
VGRQARSTQPIECGASTTHFPSSYIAHAILGYISLNVRKDSGARFEKEEKREEKVRRERERKGQVSY